jgi:hypothetical protein
MSKVKIQGHSSGSGTVTITAPNTNLDRTITLPDSTSTLFTNAGGTLTGALGGALELLRLDNTSASNYWSLAHWDGGTLDIESSGTDVLRLTSDGRGLSQFTAKAWVNFNGTTNVGGNCTIRDSHNVSSVSDDGTGSYTLNFSNTLANTDYMAQGDHNTPSGHQQNVFIRGVYSTSQLHLETSNLTYVDVTRCNVIVFGG